MTGSSLRFQALAALASLLMLAGIASAAQQGDAVAVGTQDLEEKAGALDELAQAPTEAVDTEEEPSAVDQVGRALAAVGQAIATAAQATADAVGSAAMAIAHGFAAVGHAIADAAVALGQAIAWTGARFVDGILLVGDGLAWLGSHAWTGISAIASGLWWMTTRAGDGLAFAAVNLADGIAAVAVWIGHGIADGLLAIGDAWPSDPQTQAIVASSAGGTAAAAGAAWYTRAWRYLRYAPGLAPLYTRISRDELLDHPKRASIYEAIEEAPGVHLSELSRELDLPWGTLLHHLRKLEKADLIVSDEAQGKRCFFLPGQVTSEQRSILPALENEKARRIAEFYVEHPGASQTEAAEALGYSPALISWHLQKLEDAGVVERERVGRTQRVGVTQEAMSLVAA